MAQEQENQRSMIGRAWEALKDPKQWAVLWAEGRRGLKDLQNAALNPWNGVTQTHEEPGTIASPTQAEITSERGNVRSYSNLLDGYAARGAGIETQEKGLER
jgi:hypothetical protein